MHRFVDDELGRGLVQQLRDQARDSSRVHAFAAWLDADGSAARQPVSMPPG